MGTHFLFRKLWVMGGHGFCYGDVALGRSLFSCRDEGRDDLLLVEEGVEVVHCLHTKGVAGDFRKKDMECDVGFGKPGRRKVFVVHRPGDTEDFFLLGMGDPFRREIGGGRLYADAEFDDVE